MPRVADRADIANLKLMKCGGLRETQRMIHTARAHGLEVMLGCMIESNASIAAAAHLAPLLDYADLDGSLLLAEDPYAGRTLAEWARESGGYLSGWHRSAAEDFVARIAYCVVSHGAGKG